MFTSCVLSPVMIGLVPVIALLSAQMPALRAFLFSRLDPMVQTVVKFQAKCP